MCVCAGTTVRETVSLLENTEATLTGIIIAFDRQERGEGKLSGVQEAVKTHKIPVQSIVTLSDVVQYLQSQKKYAAQLSAIEQYRKQFGV